MLTADKPTSVSLKPEDFDPPLKRKEAAVPGYWTVKELAAELDISTRYVQYLITGNPKTRLPPQLKAYKADSAYLFADEDALEYIHKTRLRRQRNKN